MTTADSKQPDETANTNTASEVAAAEPSAKKPEPAGIQLLKENLEASNKWVKFYFDDVQFGDDPNKKGKYTRIVQKNNQPGTVILALNESKHIALVKQYRYPIQRWCWEIPRGFGEEDIDSLTNAKKELAEEMNMVSDTISCLGQVSENSGILSAINKFYLALDCKPLVIPDSSETAENNNHNNRSKYGDILRIMDIAELENENITNRVFVSYQNLMTLIQNGVVIDSFTLCALQLALIQHPNLFV